MIHRFFESYYENFFINLLNNIKTGSLVLTTPSNKKYEFKGVTNGPKADLCIHDWSFIKEFIKKGDIGIFKSYQKGFFETSNLSNLLSLGALNQKYLNNIVDLKGIRKFLYTLSHRFHKNSLTGSKKNIHKHYDLSNDFFRLWLDDQMNYSAALFNNQQNISLEQAQEQKLARILEELNLPFGSHILEIGCGWGGFCEYAAKRGYKVTAITISQQQYEYALHRINQLDLSHLVEIRYCDYRQLTEQFDGIVSIEMFEAVGKAYWSTYFETLKKCLKPHSKAIIQTITIDDHHFHHYQQTPDFIQLYIFPGGMLPSPSCFIEEAHRHHLTTVNTVSFGKDYVQTLTEWLNQFNKKISSIKNLGFDDDFIQLWRYYLSYCIAGFNTERTDVIQFTLCSS